MKPPPPKRYRSSRFVVACQPWQSPSYISSEHTSRKAAERQAEQDNADFTRSNGATAYGYVWVAGCAQAGETTIEAAERITQSRY
jgi:hypothetical protein